MVRFLLKFHNRCKSIYILKNVSFFVCIDKQEETRILLFVNIDVEELYLDFTLMLGLLDDFE